MNAKGDYLPLRRSNESHVTDGKWRQYIECLLRRRTPQVHSGRMNRGKCLNEYMKDTTDLSFSRWEISLCPFLYLSISFCSFRTVCCMHMLQFLCVGQISDKNVYMDMKNIFKNNACFFIPFSQLFCPVRILCFCYTVDILMPIARKFYG